HGEWRGPPDPIGGTPVARSIADQTVEELGAQWQVARRISPTRSGGRPRTGRRRRADRADPAVRDRGQAAHQPLTRHDGGARSTGACRMSGMATTARGTFDVTMNPAPAELDGEVSRF